MLLSARDGDDRYGPGGREPSRPRGHSRGQGRGGSSIAQPVGVSVVIPAYNEADRIRDVIRDVRPHASEIVVIDDASSDSTATVAREATARVATNSENRGYVESVKRGFRLARHEVSVTIDADGELPADSIPRLVEPIADGRADMVQGARSSPVRPSERILTWLANRVAPVGDSGTGLRAVRTDLARRVEIRGRCICGVLALEAHRLGATIEEIPIDLRRIEKPRSIAWYHLGQLFWLGLEAARHVVSGPRHDRAKETTK